MVHSDATYSQDAGYPLCKSNKCCLREIVTAWYAWMAGSSW